MSETIVFFGNERLATGITTVAPTLRSLAAQGYHIAAVIANNEAGTSRKQRHLEIADAAKEFNIPLLLPERLHDLTDQLRDWNAQLGVLVAYGRMVPEEIIALFPRGIINIHPSLLPLHRGPTPIESVILKGESKTGVSIMQLVKKMDAGPVYAQKEILLTGQETKQALANKLLELGRDMLLELLPAILSGAASPTPQDDSYATYDALIQKEAGRIDWTKPAQQIEREVRAYAEWPKSRTSLKELELIVTGAHLLSASGPAGKTEVVAKRPVIYCGEQALVLDRVMPAGKKEMTGEAFLAGYKQSFLIGLAR